MYCQLIGIITQHPKLPKFNRMFNQLCSEQLYKSFSMIGRARPRVDQIIYMRNSMIFHQYHYHHSEINFVLFLGCLPYPVINYLLYIRLIFFHKKILAIKVFISILQDDQYIINLQILMIPLFLRLGPFVFIEFGFLFSAAAISFWLTVSPCFTYALIQLAISIFFIEQIVVYNLIFKSKSLKKKYIGQEVSKWNYKTSLKTFWNIMVFASCCCLIYSWIIQDTVNILFQQNQSPQSANQCSFQLYPLCFFSQQFNIKNDSLQNTIILIFLLTVFIFIETGLMGVTLGYFIAYFKAIKNYQKALIKVDYSLCETLIESKVIQNTTENIRYRKDPCSICFCQIQNSQSNVIRLRCKHEFHKQCILSWLQTKDHCPFRCQPNELA